jgi:hypothetical protein
MSSQPTEEEKKKAERDRERDNVPVDPDGMLPTPWGGR